MEVSIAAAEAVKQANVDVISAYPITPQTHIVEHLSELVANGEMDAEFFCVESEHSALSVCVGSEATGARSFTCTSSQGLALMSEITYIASALRLPIVMIIANRALSAPISIWNDHSDVMSIRDCGWIQFFAENGQDVYDQVFCAYRLAEDKGVLLPVIINMDGFTLSHVIEPIELIDQEKIDQFLPPYQPVLRLHPDRSDHNGWDCIARHLYGDEEGPRGCPPGLYAEDFGYMEGFWRDDGSVLQPHRDLPIRGCRYPSDHDGMLWRDGLCGRGSNERGGKVSWIGKNSTVATLPLRRLQEGHSPCEATRCD